MTAIGNGSVTVSGFVADTIGRNANVTTSIGVLFFIVENLPPVKVILKRFYNILIILLDLADGSPETEHQFGEAIRTKNKEGDQQNEEELAGTEAKQCEASDRNGWSGASNHSFRRRDISEDCGCCGDRGRPEIYLRIGVPHTAVEVSVGGG